MLTLWCVAVLAAGPAKPPVKTAPAPKPVPVVEQPPAPVPVVTPAPTPVPVATPAPKPAPVEATRVQKERLMVLELTRLGDVGADVAQLLTAAMTDEVAKRDVFSVMSQGELATILGVERQRQLLGCGNEECFQELAGAVGARFVLTGSLGRLGDAYQLSLQVMDTVRAQPLGRSTRIAKDVNSVRSSLAGAVAEAAALPPPPQPSVVLPIAMVGVGAAAVVGGVVLGFQAFAREEVFTNELSLSETQPGLQLKPASAYRDEARRVTEQKVLAGALVVSGAALAVVGAFLMPGDGGGGARVAVFPTTSGLFVTGSF